MLKFEHYETRPSVEIKGRTYEIPTKTAFFVDKANEIQKRIASSETAEQSARAVYDGISLFLGDKNTAELFPDINNADTDELGALWYFLCYASEQAGRELVKKNIPLAKE